MRRGKGAWLRIWRRTYARRRALLLLLCYVRYTLDLVMKHLDPIKLLDRMLQHLSQQSLRFLKDL